MLGYLDASFFPFAYASKDYTMRATLLTVGAFASLAAANINFHWVNPTCDFSNPQDAKCLTGQHCAEGDV